MQYKIPVAAAALAVAMLAVPMVSSAASLPTATQSAAAVTTQNGSLAQNIGWRRGGWGFGQCRAWRRECAARWGWGGPRYNRCLWRHGC